MTAAAEVDTMAADDKTDEKTALAPLLDGLLGWRELIGRDRDRMPKNRHHFMWRRFIGSRLSAPLSIWLTFLIVGGALQEESAAKMNSGFRMAFTFVAIDHCLLFWSAARRLHLEDLLLQMRDVALTLAPYAKYHRAQLEAAQRSSALGIWICKAYTIMDVGTLIIPLSLNQDKMELNMWPWPAGRLWVVLGGVMQVFMGAPFAFPTFATIAFYMASLKFEIALFDMLADAMREADTAAAVYEVAKLDVRLVSLGIKLRDTMAGVTTSILALMLATPLLSTVLAFLGQFDLFTIASIPYVILFIAICNLGHNMQDACGRVKSAAYGGHWLQMMKDPDARATVILLMRRRGRPLSIAATMGIGALDLKLCRETMRSWYSLLQLLIKMF